MKTLCETLHQHTYGICHLARTSNHAVIIGREFCVYIYIYVSYVLHIIYTIYIIYYLDLSTLRDVSPHSSCTFIMLIALGAKTHCLGSLIP